MLWHALMTITVPTGEFLGLIHAKRGGYEARVVAL